MGILAVNWAMEIQFDLVDLNPASVNRFYNASLFRIAKFNHTAYAFNAAGELFVDIDNHFDIEINFYHNLMNNNQYRKTSIRVPKSSLCDISDQYYPSYAMKRLKDLSNLPQYEQPDKFCPFKKVKINKILNQK